MNFKDAKNRVAARVDISTSGCWDYTLKVRPNGYARITYRGKSWYAHRLSYAAFNEVNAESFEALDVCHSCDNRRCVNPAHLFLGTRKDNMMDAVSKGRQARGFMLPQTKLSEEDKIEIMKLVKAGFLYRQIALKFNVHRVRINHFAISSGVRRYERK